MPLDPSSLASGLEAMEPTAIEAALALATAWDDYFQAASVAAIAVLPGGTAPAKAAMLGALTGMGSAAAGAQAIQSGITAYWGVIAPAATALWIVVPNAVSPAIPPPGLSGIAAALQPVFIANAQGSLSLAAAAQQIATVLHTTGGVGGTVTLILPPPAPPVPLTPIL